MTIVSAILAGGSGTSLWPLSRQSMPKQLLPLTGNRTLLQETCRRLWTVTRPDKQWIVTGNEHIHEVTGQINSLSTFFPEVLHPKAIDILAEPNCRGTGPAILWAARCCHEKYGEDSVLIVSPSDNLITIEENLTLDLERAVEEAKRGRLVSFGIKPSEADVSYGYIKIDSDCIKINSPYPVSQFIEKPQLEEANYFVSEGNWMWNSGIYVFHVGTLLKEATKFCPQIIEPFLNINPFDNSRVQDAYNNIESISIDFAIMEKTALASVIPASFGWYDVGSWKSLFQISPKDDHGNVIKGEHITLDAENSLIIGADRMIAAIGVKNLAIIDTPDVLMVCPLDQTQRVKEIVDELKQCDSRMLIEHRTVKRPWGSYTVIQEGQGYKIKKIVVMPKQTLSLQMHYHRSEHWIVVKGTAKITNGDRVFLVHENESTYIPKATVHRLENPGVVPLELIEAQCGTYLEEDDIIRFEDSYGRIGV